jgi:cellulose synthase (UDP-forming)
MTTLVPSLQVNDSPAPHAYAPERSPVMTLLVVIATVGVLTYTVFLLAPSHRGDALPYLLIIAAESILVFHALLSMWTILSGQPDPRTYAFHQAREKMYAHTTDSDSRRWPLTLHSRRATVDVFITVYGEPVETVRRTVAAAVQIRGSHGTWVLDDGASDAVQGVARELGAYYVRRLGSHGAKAGNVNNALSLSRSEFFVVLDADFVPNPDFIEQTLPFFTDHGLAFVQSPQAYGNAATSTIAKGASYMQAVFYRFIQPGRNRFNAAFCVGTNVMFRRAAIIDVGGMYTDSKSEDVWTSLMLHERGWRTIFIPEVLAVGDAPESVEAYSKQQLRWATGGFEILFKHRLFSKRSGLTMDQRIQYFVTSTFYLAGIAPLLLLLVPPLEIYFDLRPMDMSISVGMWALFYAGFYIMQIVLAWFTLGSFRWETLTLATVSFPIYTKALFNVLRGKDVGWEVTGSVKTRSPYNFMVPQMLFFAFLLLTSFVAIWRDITNGVFTLATAWNVTNTIVLGAFMLAARREARALRRAGIEERRRIKQAKRAPRVPRRTPLTALAADQSTTPSGATRRSNRHQEVSS